MAWPRIARARRGRKAMGSAGAGRLPARSGTTPIALHMTERRTETGGQAMNTSVKKCPYCGQPITRAIRARIRQMEQKRLNSLAIKAREQAEERLRRELEAQRQTLKKQHDHEVMKLK